jgi:hypothetical protein
MVLRYFSLHVESGEEKRTVIKTGLPANFWGDGNSAAHAICSSSSWYLVTMDGEPVHNLRSQLWPTKFPEIL